MTKKKPKVEIKPNKLALWLLHYTNENCSTTLFNKTESARQAGYNAKETSLQSIGCQNYRKLKDKISEWLDEHGLSENALKERLVKGFDVSETKIINVKGEIKKEELPQGARLLFVGVLTKCDKQGNDYDELTSVIALDMASIEVQRKFLDMGLKMKGLYAAEHHIIEVKPLITYKDTTKEQIEGDSEIPQITDG